jgi:hypothetical protein
MNDKSDGHTVRSSEWQQCMVAHCSVAAELTWTTGTAWRSWTVEWAVCPAHYRRLRADEAFEPVLGQPPTWQRRMLMGDDMGSQASQTIDH